MKTTIPKNKLLQILTPVIGSIGRLSPILANVLIDCDGSYIRATTSNLSHQMAAVIDVDSAEFKCLVDAKKLLGIVRSAKSDINFNLTEKNLIIKSGSSRFTLSLSLLEEFPFMSPPKSKGKVIIDQPEFKAGIVCTKASMPENDVRYYLNGMCLDIGETSRLVTTTGKIMSVKEINIDSDIERQSIIPRQAVNEIEKLLVTGECTIDLAEGYITILANNITMHIRLIDGRYPNYMAVIPETVANEFVVNNALIKESIQTVGILSDSKLNEISVNVADNKIKITAVNTHKEESSDTIDTEYSGEPIAFTAIGEQIVNAMDSSDTSVIKINEKRSHITIINKALHVVCLVLR